MKLLTRLFHKPGVSAPEPGEPSEERWGTGSVAGVLRHFPIGSRVLYSPEFKKELRLESIILGCSINQHVVCAQNDLLLPGGSGGESLVLRDGPEEQVVTEVKSFYLVVPHQLRSEMDYLPRDRGSEAQMVQNAVNDFDRGNFITLISYSPYGRVPHLETRVKAVSSLTNGFYTGQKVVFLDPYAGTLSYLDKRRQQRVTTRIPVSVQLPPDSRTHACLLEDFSERFMRIRVTEPDAVYEGMENGQRLFVRLELPHADRTVVVQGSVYRKARGAVVAEVKAILRDGRFANLHLVDQLDLKATLLHHPVTQALLEKQRRSALRGGAKE